MLLYRPLRCLHEVVMPEHENAVRLQNAFALLEPLPTPFDIVIDSVPCSFPYVVRRVCEHEVHRAIWQTTKSIEHVNIVHLIQFHRHSSFYSLPVSHT